MKPTNAQTELARRIVSVVLEKEEAAWSDVAEMIAERESETFEAYSGKDGHRQWGNHVSMWFYPGDRLIMVNDDIISPST